jgi:hypothetical protein
MELRFSFWEDIYWSISVCKAPCFILFLEYNTEKEMEVCGRSVCLLTKRASNKASTIFAMLMGKLFLF